MVGLARLMRIMVNMNDNPMQMRNGISYSPAAFGYAVYNRVSFPNTCVAKSLKNTDKPNPLITPTTAAALVVLACKIESQNKNLT